MVDIPSIRPFALPRVTTVSPGDALVIDGTTTRSILASDMISSLGYPAKDAGKATIVITADVYRTTYDIARFELINRGIPCTWFVIPEGIDLGGQPTRAELVALIDNGWEIGAYSNADMVALRTSDRETAFDRMLAMQTAMRAKGFDTRSMAPQSRAWNLGLANMSRQIFRNVRSVGNVTDFQHYPIADRNYVDLGGSVSFGNTWTLAAMQAKLDALIADGGIWIPNVHLLGMPEDPLTMDPAKFFAFLDYVKVKMDAGLLRAVTFDAAMTR